MPVHNLKANSKKLRADDKHVEFLCVACKKESRITKSTKNVCLKVLKNGAYIMSSSVKCATCDKMLKLSRIISKAMGDELIANKMARCTK